MNELGYGVNIWGAGFGSAKLCWFVKGHVKLKGGG